MEKNRCQVCEGPIVNGRCRLCGMPYRNDETLYHLNENRSDHYQHATNRAKAMMRQEEIPLGDSLEGKNGSTYGRKSGGRNPQGQGVGKTQSAYGKPAGKEQSAYGKPAGKEQSAYGKPAGKEQSAYGKPAGKEQNAYGKPAGKEQSTYGQINGKTVTYRRDFNKGKKGNRIAILIFVFFLLCAGLSVIQKGVHNGFEAGFVNESGETFNSDNFELYALYPEETLEVGVDIPEGHYIASSEEDTIQFVIKGSGFEMGVIEVSQDAPQRITLTEGDRIRILQAESGNSRVVLSKVEE